jgi:hypothetical protein
MAKTKQLPLTPEQLRNEEVNYSFEQIIKDGLQTLTTFEAPKYRTIITVNHADNEKYPNLVKEAVCYFWTLTLSKGKTGNLVLYFTADSEAITKFGTLVHNRMLRSIFKHTMKEKNDIDIEDAVRIGYDTRDIHNFYFKRFMDGESDTVKIKALEHVKA